MSLAGGGRTPEPLGAPAFVILVPHHVCPRRGTVRASPAFRPMPACPRCRRAGLRVAGLPQGSSGGGGPPVYDGGFALSSGPRRTDGPRLRGAAAESPGGRGATVHSRPCRRLE